MKATNYIELPYNIPIVDPNFYKTAQFANWHKINAGQFLIEAPNDFLFTKLMGIDSKIGLLSNGHDTLFFEFGWHASDLSTQQCYSTTTTWENIGGRKFKMISSEMTGSFIGAYTNDLQDSFKFNIVCNKTEDQEKVRQIYRTIRFRK
jgi:hypothetical protein